MIDDVITLISSNGYIKDSVGNLIPAEPNRRQVFCGVSSIMRNEYYQAAQTDLHPEYTFVLTHYKDWNGERKVEYTDWTGRTRLFDVIRVYRVPDSDRLELTVQERIADYVDNTGADEEAAG